MPKSAHGAPTFRSLSDGQFAAAMERIAASLGARTQVAMAGMMNIRQSSISDAKRRRRIPDRWLLKLVIDHNLNPVWILYGTGSKHLAPQHPSPPPQDYEAILRNASVPLLLRILAIRMGRPDIPIGDDGIPLP